MHRRWIPLIIIMGMSLLLTSCSTGVHVKMRSTAPDWGPVFLGMKRSEAERHLGTPMYVTRLNDNQYSGIYEYPSVINPKETLSYDVMDFTTLGLSNLIISPIDRFKRSKHLVAVIYQMDDKFVSNDRVIDIKEKIKVSRDK